MLFWSGWQNTLMTSLFSTKASSKFNDKLAYAIARGDEVEDACVNK